MQKSGGLIALLLIAAILFMPSENTPGYEHSQVSPQAVCGDTAVQSDTLPQDDNGNDTAQIIAVVIVVILVIIFIGYISNTETG